jgi:hypothetical protein
MKARRMHETESTRGNGKRAKDNEGKPKKFICDCGQPAKRQWSSKGMEHNHGRAFYQCGTKTCEFWVWADGSLPFNDYMDAINNDWEEPW